MPLITWDQSYSVGVAELDGHHKQLIWMLNELHFAMTSDRGQDIIRDIVVEMLAYARMHFSIEEGYMRKSQYLGHLQHLTEHKNFELKAQELAQRCREGEFVLSLEVVRFLSDWLKAHILDTDMKYVSALHEKGFR